MIEVAGKVYPPGGQGKEVLHGSMQISLQQGSRFVGILDDQAMRRDQYGRPLCHKGVEAFDDLRHRASEGPIVSGHAWKPFLKAVELPDLAGPVNKVAGKSDSLSFILQDVRQAAVGMARRSHHANRDALPLESLSWMQLAIGNDGLGQNHQLRAEIVAVVQDSVRFKPKFRGTSEEAGFRCRYADLNASFLQQRSYYRSF